MGAGAKIIVINAIVLLVAIGTLEFRQNPGRSPNLGRRALVSSVGFGRTIGSLPFDFFPSRPLKGSPFLIPSFVPQGMGLMGASLYEQQTGDQIEVHTRLTYTTKNGACHGHLTYEVEVREPSAGKGPPPGSKRRLQRLFTICDGVGPGPSGSYGSLHISWSDARGRWIAVQGNGWEEHVLRFALGLDAVDREEWIHVAKTAPYRSGV